MARIVDQYGNPIERQVLDEPQTARLSSLYHEFATHPSRGLTPPKLARILQAAEEGDLIAQSDLFEDMEEKDGHIAAELSKRKRALLTLDWDVVAPRNASKQEEDDAAYVRDVLCDISDFEDVLFDALDAIGKAYSCQEIEWALTGSEWLPRQISHRPASWFQVNPDNRNELRLRDNTPLGAALIPFGWIVHIAKAKSGYLPRAGLHRVLAWPYLFKQYSARDLAEFLEIYGLPLRLGKYPTGTSEEEKATLMRAVVGIGHAAAGIVPQGMEIDFQKASEGTNVPFQAMIDWCEKTESKAILGGTLTTQADGKSSTNALGNVHNEVRHDLLVSDARQLAATITRDLIYPLLALNRGGVADMRRLPRLQFDTREAEDFSMLSEAIPKLVQVGARIPVSFVHEKLRIPEPQDDEPVLAVAAPTPAPGVPAAARSRIAALRAGQEQDEFDEFTDELASDWQRVTSPIVAPLLAAARDARSFDEFQARLPELLREMDIDQLMETLAQGQFAAAIWGRVNNG